MAAPKVLILGCSIAGPALASCLLLSPSSPKPRITILERAPSLRHTGQNIDIRDSGVAVIRKLGIESIIRAHHTGEEGISHVDERNQVWAQIAADKTGKINTPTADIEILRGKLSEILVARSKTCGEVEYIFGDTIDQLDQDGDGVTVRFKKSQEERRFDILVGADGLHSTVRKLAWSPEENPINLLGLYAAFFSLPKGENDDEWMRWFHATQRRTIMIRPHEDKALTTALMTVYSDSDERLSSAYREGPAVQRELMTEYFRDAGWETNRILEQMNKTSDFYYDVVGQIKVNKLSKGRIVLLGDAGYCASFLSGMGTTLALTGAYHLAGCLSRHSGDYETAFAEYEKAMRPTINHVQSSVTKALWLFRPNTARQLWIINHLFYFLWCCAPLFRLLFSLGRKDGEEIKIEDYGFTKVEELKEADLKQSMK